MRSSFSVPDHCNFLFWAKSTKPKAPQAHLRAKNNDVVPAKKSPPHPHLPVEITSWKPPVLKIFNP